MEKFSFYQGVCLDAGGFMLKNHVGTILGIFPSADCAADYARHLQLNFFTIIRVHVKTFEASQTVDDYHAL